MLRRFLFLAPPLLVALSARAFFDPMTCGESLSEPVGHEQRQFTFQVIQEAYRLKRLGTEAQTKVTYTLLGHLIERIVDEFDPPHDLELIEALQALEDRVPSNPKLYRKQLEALASAPTEELGAEILNLANECAGSSPCRIISAPLASIHRRGIQNGGTLADLSAEFDVIFRHAGKPEMGYVHEADAALSAPGGLVFHKIKLGSRGRLEALKQSAKEIVFSREPKSKAGQRTYALIFPKGFIKTYQESLGRPEGDPVSFRTDQVFKIDGGRILSTSEYVTNNAIGIAEIEPTGKITQGHAFFGSHYPPHVSIDGIADKEISAEAAKKIQINLARTERLIELGKSSEKNRKDLTELYSNDRITLSEATDASGQKYFFYGFEMTTPDGKKVRVERPALLDGNTAAWDGRTHEGRRLIEQLIEGAKGRKGALVMVDVNNLGFVNTFAHKEAGDRYLRAAMEAILNSLRKEDIAFRWGGDEYFIYLKGVSPEEAQRKLERIVTEVHSSHEVQAIFLEQRKHLREQRDLISSSKSFDKLPQALRASLLAEEVKLAKASFAEFRTARIHAIDEWLKKAEHKQPGVSPGAVMLQSRNVMELTLEDLVGEAVAQAYQVKITYKDAIGDINPDKAGANAVKNTQPDLNALPVPLPPIQF